MSLLKTAANGMAWTTTSTVVRSVVQLLQIAILTRYLDKSDFGLVAIATLFLGFTQLFLDMGISAGIIHKQDITPHQYSTLFWLNVITGTVLTLILCVFSPFIASIYNEPELLKILILLSFTVFFSSLGSQHRTVQQKLLRFKYISIVEIVSSVSTLILAVYLAMTGWGIYSLVFSSLFLSASSSLFFLVIGLYKDRNISFHFKLQESYPFLRIGIFSVGSSILDYLSRELDILIISSTLSKESVGLYSLCKKLIITLYGTVNPILTKVLTPLLATIQKDVDKVRTVYYNIVESLAIINYPIYVLVAIFSHGIITFLYGNQYVDGAIPMSLIALTYALNTPGNVVGSLQVAMGRTDSGFYWTIIRIVFTTIAIAIGSQYGLNGLALGGVSVSFFVNPIFWKITIHSIIGGKYIDYFKITILPMIYILIIFSPLYYFINNITGIFHIIGYSMLILFGYFVIVYNLFPSLFIVKKIKIIMGYD